MMDFCSNCKFGVLIQEKRLVVCRRYPPHPVAVVGEPGGTLQGYWPRTGPDDTCGEHKFK